MSPKRNALSLFLFRRDLRLEDNTALIGALKESERVIPCFIFDDRQINQHAYFSENAFAFMLHSLQDLENALRKKNGRLYFFQGIAETVVEKLLSDLPIDAVYFNRDYTPFSLARDRAIQKITEKMGRRCFVFSDALLHEPEEMPKSDGTPYTIFTPFFRKAIELPVGKPVACPSTHFYTNALPIESDFFKTHIQHHKDRCAQFAGRTAAKKLHLAIAQLKNYARDRDFPALQATSHLSAHHKFGTVSIRESYYAIKNSHVDATLIKELFWRDFFTHIAFHFPVVFGSAFHEKYRHIHWENDVKKFERWCNGETGFPIVDAGMRELNKTGLMHNRVRMITASFLVKDLHIDWRWGERYFAQKLMDYDPAVNNGNWQWAASTGCDAQPYFRIFNPWLQQKKYDADALYIKQWVPELGNQDLATLHSAERMMAADISRYPKPIVNHAVASARAKALYQVSV